MDVKELAQIIKLLKKNHVKYAEINGICLQFGEETKSNYRQKKDALDKPVVETAYSDEDALFWSTGGIN